MTYRKIDVDGTPYEFQSDNDYVYIRGMGSFLRSRSFENIEKIKPNDVIDFITKLKQK